MDQIIITKPDTTTWALITRSNVTAVTKGEQKRTLLGEDVIIMTVESAVKLTFDIGDKITVFGSIYILNALPKLLKGGKRKFTYDITWEGRQYDLLRVICFDEDEGGVSISSDFSLTGNLATFMAVIINNLERVYGSGKWILGDCPETDYLTLTFSNENCLAVLQRLCGEDTFNKEFEITEAAGVCTIDVKDAIGQNLPQTYEYGKGKGLYTLTRETVSNKNIITRLYAFGANKNLASDYRGFSQRLKLPSINLSYIEDAIAKAAFGLIEGVKFFDDIFPHRAGTVTSLGTTVYQFIDAGMDFDLNAVDGGGNTIYLINGTSAKIHFNTGNLAGYEFEILSYVHATKTFTIKAFKDERGQAFPDPDTSAFQLTAGDKYVILDIILPQSYIDTAESALLAAAEDYLDQNCQPRVTYALTIDELFLINYYPGETIVNVYNTGDYLPIEDSDIGVDKSIRVKSFTRDIFRHYCYTLSLSDVVESSMLQRLIASTIETEKVIVLNKLNDVARAKRSWKSTRELLDMVFDTDGYFDGTNIKPNSIETLMISVGARSQQFTNNCIIEPNFEGQENVVNVTAGTLSHYAIEDEIRDWSISAAETILTESTAYYIYAKVEKANNAGSIIFSHDQIRVNDDANYYHFMLGILHAVDETTDTRWISLTYGATAINGRYIKTGVISSADGLTFFDLDAGRIELGNVGISGELIEVDPDDDIRIWGGASHINRTNAPFQLLNDGRGIFKKGLIGGWTIDTDAIFTGTKKTSEGYTADGITIASNGSIRSKYFEIKESGKAKFESVDSIFKSATVGAGDLAGSVENTQANVTGQSEIDEITITGTYGSAFINCNGYSQLMDWYGATINDTINNYISLYGSDWVSNGVTLANIGSNKIRLSSVLGVAFSEEAAIYNDAGDLDGTESHIQDAIIPVARIDTITLTGDSGEANIQCDALTKKAYFNETRTKTASDFVDANAANYLSGGVILTSNGEYVILTAQTAGVNFTGDTTITNVPVTDIGSVKIQGNNIWENDINADNGSVQINLKGFGGATSKYRSLRIGDGKGNIIARFYGTPTGPVILFPLLKTSSSGCIASEIYRDGSGSGATLKIK